MFNRMEAFLFVLQKNTGRARIKRPCRYCIIRLQICYRIRKRLAGAMVRQRHSARCGMAQIHDHQDLFVSGRPSSFASCSGSKKLTQQLSTPALAAARIMWVATMVASSTPESRLPPG